jgi:hypothetical protein
MYHGGAHEDDSLLEYSAVCTAFFLRALMMEALRISETAYSNEATWRNIPERSHLHTRRRQNLEFQEGHITETIFLSSIHSKFLHIY